MSVRRFHDVYEKEDLEKIQEVIKEGGWSLHHRFEKFPLKHAQKHLDDEFFTVHLFNKIKKRLNLADSTPLVRVYMNYYFPGMCGSWHQDNYRSDFYTFTTYVTDIPKEDLDLYGGNLDIKTENDDAILSFPPETNSGVLFPCTAWHRGQGSSPYYKDVRKCRVVLTWKMGIAD